MNLDGLARCRSASGLPRGSAPARARPRPAPGSGVKPPQVPRENPKASWYDEYSRHDSRRPPHENGRAGRGDIHTNAIGENRTKTSAAELKTECKHFTPPRPQQTPRTRPREAARRSGRFRRHLRSEHTAVSQRSPSGACWGAGRRPLVRVRERAHRCRRWT